MEKNVARLIEKQEHLSSGLTREWQSHQDRLICWLNEDLGGEVWMDSSAGSSIPAVVETSTNQFLPFSASSDLPGATKNGLSEVQQPSKVPVVCSDSADRHKEKAYLVSQLKSNLRSLGDETHYVRNAIQEGAELIKQFEEVLSMKSLDLDQDVKKSPRIHDR